MAKIKVALVEDSLVALEILKRLINSSDEAEVVGTATEGNQALPMIAQTQPDVICTDLDMPGMDGLEFTKQVMANYPTPVLVVSNAVHPHNVDNIYNLMEAGALDFFPKPSTGNPTDYQKLTKMLITKLRILANKKV